MSIFCSCRVNCWLKYKVRINCATIYNSLLELMCSLAQVCLDSTSTFSCYSDRLLHMYMCYSILQHITNDLMNDLCIVGHLLISTSSCYSDRLLHMYVCYSILQMTLEMTFVFVNIVNWGHLIVCLGFRKVSFHIRYENNVTGEYTYIVCELL